MPRIEDVLNIYSLYQGYAWRVNNDFICEANVWFTGDPADYSIRCTRPETGEKWFYRDILAFIASLPKIVDKIEVIDMDGNIIKTFYHVKNIFSKV